MGDYWEHILTGHTVSPGRARYCETYIRDGVVEQLCGCGEVVWVREGSRRQWSRVVGEVVAAQRMAAGGLAYGIYPPTARDAAPETKAQVKARALLRSKLNPGQRRCFDKFGHFFVTGESGTVYKIGYGSVYTSDGESLCVYPENKSDIPIWDTMLALKLSIESDEKNFLKTANHMEALRPLNIGGER